MSDRPGEADGAGAVAAFTVTQGSRSRPGNLVARTAGPPGYVPGSGNQVVIVGTAERFERSNDGFERGTDLTPFFEP